MTFEEVKCEASAVLRWANTIWRDLKLCNYDYVNVSNPSLSFKSNKMKIKKSLEPISAKPIEELLLQRKNN